MTACCRLQGGQQCTAPVYCLAISILLWVAPGAREDAKQGHVRLPVSDLISQGFPKRSDIFMVQIHRQRPKPSLMDHPHEDVNNLLLVRETIDDRLVGPEHSFEKERFRSGPVSSDRGRMPNTSRTKGVSPSYVTAGKLPREGKSVPDGCAGPGHGHEERLSVHGLYLRKRTGGPLACEGKGHERTVGSKCPERHLSPARTPWVHGCSCVSILCFCRSPGTPPRTEIIPRKDRGCVTSGILTA